MGALGNLSLRRNVGPAQARPQQNAFLTNFYVDVNLMALEFDKPLTTGTGTIIAGYYLDLSFAITPVTLTQVSPTRFQGAAVGVENAALGFLLDGGSWKTASNGILDGTPKIAEDFP